MMLPTTVAPEAGDFGTTHKAINNNITTQCEAAADVFVVVVATCGARV